MCYDESKEIPDCTTKVRHDADCLLLHRRKRNMKLIFKKKFWIAFLVAIFMAFNTYTQARFSHEYTQENLEEYSYAEAPEDMDYAMEDATQEAEDFNTENSKYREQDREDTKPNKSAFDRAILRLKLTAQKIFDYAATEIKKAIEDIKTYFGWTN